MNEPVIGARILVKLFLAVKCQSNFDISCSQRKLTLEIGITTRKVKDQKIKDIQ